MLLSPGLIHLLFSTIGLGCTADLVQRHAYCVSQNRPLRYLVTVPVHPSNKPRHMCYAHLVLLHSDWHTQV